MMDMVFVITFKSQFDILCLLQTTKNFFFINAANPDTDACDSSAFNIAKLFSHSLKQLSIEDQPKGRNIEHNLYCDIFIVHHNSKSN